MTELEHKCRFNVSDEVGSPGDTRSTKPLSSVEEGWVNPRPFFDRSIIEPDSRAIKPDANALRLMVVATSSKTGNALIEGVAQFIGTELVECLDFKAGKLHGFEGNQDDTGQHHRVFDCRGTVFVTKKVLGEGAKFHLHCSIGKFDEPV